MASDKIDFIKKWADTHTLPFNLTEEEIFTYEKLCAGGKMYAERVTPTLKAYLIKNKKFWGYDCVLNTYELLDSVTDNVCNDKLIEDIIDELHYGLCQFDGGEYYYRTETIFVDNVFQDGSILNVFQNNIILDVLGERLTDIIGHRCVCQCHKNSGGIDCTIF